MGYTGIKLLLYLTTVCTRLCILLHIMHTYGRVWDEYHTDFFFFVPEVTINRIKKNKVFDENRKSVASSCRLTMDKIIPGHFYSTIEFPKPKILNLHDENRKGVASLLSVG